MKHLVLVFALLVGAKPALADYSVRLGLSGDGVVTEEMLVFGFGLAVMKSIEAFELGGTLRVHPAGLPTVFAPPDGSLGLTARYWFGATPQRGPQVGAHVSFGWQTGCFRGDFCGGSGLRIDADVGWGFPLASRWTFLATLGLGVQTGLVNGVGAFPVINVLLAAGWNF